MRHLTLKDQYRRKRSFNSEPKHILVRSFQDIGAVNFSEYSLARLQKFYRHFSRNSSIHRVVNRCVLTRRSRAVYRFFSMERRVLRRYAMNARLPGIRRVLW